MAKSVIKAQKTENKKQTTKSEEPKTKVKKGVWFVAIRGSYLPCSWQGWLSYLPFTAYLVFTLIFGWRASDSVALAVLFIVSNWAAAAAVMTWFAKRHS